ncbi:hypothetical protein KTU01_31210 [Kocuria turfanensis]|uniref:Restriction endonuclease type IV Mrr domain-containing protein n=2 Tax=Kocuria turfanensis TaxID=388357 RepID=A0A512IH71_9MICC|nr:hypothetical protein KTU01_31210 [Kocuria turfanensis]
MPTTAIWGIHNDALRTELVDEGFVSVGWDEIGDLKEIGNDRSRMKQAVEGAYPEAKPGAIPVWAGILLRFAFEMRIGDLVIAPYKPDGTLNFGRVTGEYEFHPEVEEHYHRRRVEWIRTGVPRGIFPQKALYEIGSALTLFRVKNNVAAFLVYLDQPSGTVEEASRPVVVDEEAEHLDEWAADEPSAGKLHQYTEDFVRKTLLEELTHEEFEYFTADLLRALGYQARVTPYVADGGIDVVAHKDPLGLEPPLLKVQCKHTAAVQSRPDVQRLIGTLSVGELGLFVTMGSYSRDAVDLERVRQDLRLLTGQDVVEMTLRHYKDLPQKWRSRMPLREVYVVDRESEGR